MRIANLIKNTKQAFTIQPNNARPMTSIQRIQQSKSAMKFALLAGLSLLALEPTIAMAAAATDNLTTAANSILGLLTGTLGKAVATIAVVIMGMMAMFGKLEWERAFKVILGIAIVFGAASVITLIGGTTTIGAI